MTGQIALIIRIGLYFLGGWLASRGLAGFDPTAGTITLQVDQIAQAISGLGAVLAAIGWRGFAKASGGVT